MLKFISYNRFAKLRFADFLIGQMETETRKNWEFMGRRWSERELVSASSFAWSPSLTFCD